MLVLSWPLGHVAATIDTTVKVDLEDMAMRRPAVPIFGVFLRFLFVAVPLPGTTIAPGLAAWAMDCRALTPLLTRGRDPFYRMEGPAIRHHIAWKLHAMNNRSTFLSVMLVAAGILPLSGTAKDLSQRPARVNDAFEREELRPEGVTLSPDGRALAFTRRRAASSQVTNAFLVPETRDDVWVQESSGESVRNLTQGAADASGWWDAKWSPNGQRLTMLSSRGGQVTPWVWERTTDELRQVSRQGVDFEGDDAGCRWLDDVRLLCTAVPEGDRSTPTGSGVRGGGPFVGKVAEKVIESWARAARGEVTASTVDSLTFPRERRRLLLIDVRTGTDRLLAITAKPIWGETTWWIPSNVIPHALAYVPPLPAQYPREYRSRIGNPRMLKLRSVEGHALALDKGLPANVITETLRWSPDGKDLAFFTLGEAVIHPELIYGAAAPEVQYPAVSSKEYPGKLWRVNIENGRVEQWDTGAVDLGNEAMPPPFEWMASGELLFRATRLVDGARPLRASAPEWVVLERGGRTRPLLEKNTTLPESLRAIENSRAFVGLIQGEVWKIDPVAGTSSNLTTRFKPEVLALQEQEFNDGRGHSYLVVKAGEPASDYGRTARHIGLETESESYVLETTGETTQLKKPVPNARLAEYSPLTKSSVFVADNANGSFLWRSPEVGQAERLVATNLFVKDIGKAESRYIEYTSNNGEKLRAVLHLPVNYLRGKLYPLVVDSDIGSSSLVGGVTTSGSLTVRRSSDQPAIYSYEAIFADNFTSAGYAYMFVSWPSMSMDVVGGVSRANLLLGPNGVVPAVDEVIRQGIVDPDRLFLYGQSSMGYGVFGLVTQTSRFTAAIAEAGGVDKTTQRPGAGLPSRYSENPFEFVNMNPPYTRISLPFWRNADYLRRNSPLSYVDRVRTPLMIVAGDLDGSVMEQSEMFFDALVMQRKPAQFVRYWGEGHSNRTPANVRDQWQRMLAWFDQWGDITRDESGNFVWSGDRVQSRNGAPPLKPEHYAKFDMFGPGGEQGTKQWRGE